MIMYYTTVVWCYIGLKLLSRLNCIFSFIQMNIPFERENDIF